MNVLRCNHYSFYLSNITKWHSDLSVFCTPALIKRFLQPQRLGEENIFAIWRSTNLYDIVLAITMSIVVLTVWLEFHTHYIYIVIDYCFSRCCCVWCPINLQGQYYCFISCRKYVMYYEGVVFFFNTYGTPLVLSEIFDIYILYKITLYRPRSTKKFNIGTSIISTVYTRYGRESFCVSENNKNNRESLIHV